MFTTLNMLMPSSFSVGGWDIIVFWKRTNRGMESGDKGLARVWIQRGPVAILFLTPGWAES
jgi:hypothetical protein